jgi:TRAP-type C4-dicarboxylate transport system permease small subunit
VSPKLRGILSLAGLLLFAAMMVFLGGFVWARTSGADPVFWQKGLLWTFGIAVAAMAVMGALALYFIVSALVKGPDKE